MPISRDDGTVTRRRVDASRIDKLLQYDDPASPEHAMARFAAETVVAQVPGATLEEHEALMDARLQNALVAQDAAEALAKTGAAIQADAAAAATAWREARCAEAQTVLAAAEESTVDGPTRARIRSVRAQAALVRGDALAAAGHYVAGAGYLEAEGPETEETMLFRSRGVGHLIRHADLFGGDGGWIGDAMELCNANIRRRDSDTWNKGARQMDAGSAQLSAGRLKAAPEALDLLMGAEYSFRIASRHFDQGGFASDWAAAQNARGLAQAHFCFRYEEATGKPPPEGSWTGAEDCYRAAMDVRVNESPVQWAKTRINLGYLQLHRGQTEGGEAGAKRLRQAVEDCRGAQEVLRADVETEVWVDAQQILAEALLELAGMVPPEEAMSHLLRAMAELTTAKDVLADAEDLPFEKAGIDRLLARLERQTARLGGA
ncbi:MAG: hypothetical protein F4Y41_16620 [Gammaproteobacteria bacterium]|nr:hypothetical protein [Gammaproteobacteria bacterium]